MDTGKLILFGGLAVAAYYVYETFFAGPPASWTAAGGTAAQWTALTSAQQAQWNTQTAAATSAPAATAATTATPAAASTATPATGAVPAPHPRSVLRLLLPA